MNINSLAAQKILLVQETCGLSDSVRVLFSQNGLEPEEYEGRALGYHVLEKWASMGIGATLLPASHVSDVNYARPIEVNSGQLADIAFVLCWARSQEMRPYFSQVVSGFHAPLSEKLT